MGTTQSAISRLEEGGGGAPKIDTLVRLAAALGRWAADQFPLRRRRSGSRATRTSRVTPARSMSGFRRSALEACKHPLTAAAVPRRSYPLIRQWPLHTIPPRNPQYHTYELRSAGTCEHAGGHSVQGDSASKCGDAGSIPVARSLSAFYLQRRSWSIRCSTSVPGGRSKPNARYLRSRAGDRRRWPCAGKAQLLFFEHARNLQGTLARTEESCSVTGHWRPVRVLMTVPVSPARPLSQQYWA
ncbi:MAG: helix-turn-helix domain-containing protein [Egibacteraceae bacterium]